MTSYDSRMYCDDIAPLSLVFYLVECCIKKVCSYVIHSQYFPPDKPPSQTEQRQPNKMKPNKSSLFSHILIDLHICSDKKDLVIKWMCILCQVSHHISLLS